MRLGKVEDHHSATYRLQAMLHGKRCVKEFRTLPRRRRTIEAYGAVTLIPEDTGELPLP
jgi:hypothetical protein